MMSMYSPQMFIVSQDDTIMEVVRRYPFATLSGAHTHGQVLANVPCLVKVSGRGVVRLLGHVARDNPFTECCNGKKVTAQFNGPNAYIPPQWNARTENYPTWWSAIVQASGSARLLDVTETRDHLAELIAAHEVSSGWTIELMPEHLNRHLMQFIVPFEITVERFETCFRVGQNKKPDDHASILKNLLASRNPDWAYLADIAAREYTRLDPDAVAREIAVYVPNKENVGQS